MSLAAVSPVQAIRSEFRRGARASAPARFWRGVRLSWQRLAERAALCRAALTPRRAVAPAVVVVARRGR
jgi:hypothetical protein